MFFRKRKEEDNEQIPASISCFKEDQEKVTNGAPIYPMPDNADLFFNVLRVGTFEQQKQMADVTRSVYGAHAPRQVDNNKLWAVWLAEYGVTDWGYLEDENGKVLKFTRETCRSIFNNKDYRNTLVPTLINGASDYYSYLQDEALEAIEEIKKR
ncbi:hypothetical protein PP590_gp72 [Pseudoalteromonas phage HS1]|uniref:hypothetical protein n=1 Tax=Pseudoalteromonas phage HS5 TaxID=1357709 RepID=UPI002329662D|nr:hypothetical protein PP589_gp69 [Pseudoalteromonas phage HS5]YP_010660229.1 hypothetical protein PP590_gp72 [Pseudoalteromonas phage HS1]